MKRVTPLFSREQIERRVVELGHEIRRDAGNSEVCLIGILKGASVFLTDLLRAIPGDVHYEWVNVLREVADTETADALELDFLAPIDMAGRHVYMIKDVVSTGIIETYLLSQFRTKNPADLKLVALLDVPESRRIQLIADFQAFTSSRGVFVGYGLEFEGRYGSLPFLGTI
jgi:hypoxanthine phosphoribosyltransferase